MKIKQYKWIDFVDNDEKKFDDADVVFVFASRLFLEKFIVVNSIPKFFYGAEIIYCSSAGEISNSGITDNSITCTAIKFDNTPIKAACINIENFENVQEAAFSLAGKLYTDNLRHILVFADGQKVNGSQLTAGLNRALHKGVSVSGGLAGDDNRFQKTLVGLNNNLKEGNIAAVGFYGDHIIVGNGCKSGWEPFGNSKVVTRAEGNILYELDGMPVLELYKSCLGDLTAQLPESALHFPLWVKFKDEEPVVRTVLNVNENHQSLIFAGDVPEGAVVQFMKASSRNILNAARNSAAEAVHFVKQNPELAILVSCVGRKLLLGKKTSEEIDEAKSAFGNLTTIAGFYSYGEITPHRTNKSCSLQNQSITITTLFEI